MSVGAFAKTTGHFQPKFNLVLLVDDDLQPRVSLGKQGKCLVMRECRADEHDVIKLATEGAATELVHKDLRLPQVGWSDDERVEGDIVGIHFNAAQILAVCPLC